MSHSEGGLSKDDFLSQIFSVCTTLTPEAMSAASEKAKELGFDENRPLVPLAESFSNLSSTRVILEDAIEKGKLVLLPITVQRDFLSNLEAISKSLKGLTDGVDEIVNLSNAIEVLNTSVWKYGLHNLSDQVLGYQKKLNQLKNQELQITKAISHLESVSKAAERANGDVATVEKLKSVASDSVEQLKKNLAASDGLLGQLKDADAQSKVLSAAIQQHEKDSSETISKVKTGINEVIALDSSIRKFYDEVDEYRRKIAQTTDDASKLITSSEATFRKLIEDTTTQIQQAVKLSEAALKLSFDDSVSKVDIRIEQANKDLDKLSSDVDIRVNQAVKETARTSADLSKNFEALQTSSDEKLDVALKRWDQSSKDIASDAEVRIKAAETALETNAVATVATNQQKTADLIVELGLLKDQVKDQIQQATGFALFGAFQARQNEIVKSKKYWAVAIFAFVIISAGVTAWIAYEAKDYHANDLAFWVKLSLTIPLAFAIGFSTLQYGRERRLEEEYAFKASISVSLNPYRDLVHSILQKDGVTDQTKYADFVIESVKGVFTPPTDKVFEGEKKSGLTQKTFEQTAKIIGAAVKAAK